ncbi:non-ribosomal peptide synthetase [Streptomyces sp. L2]|uniref:non-ribosomal peptide synthetase n=1 Tax=Streptomyces sp. L2 TaxID=2162665 RepID=UPI00101179FC|nr:non-ribosomal peptide synthetase [Streptomyces sp. L2]
MTTTTGDTTFTTLETPAATVETPAATVETPAATVETPAATLETPAATPGATDTAPGATNTAPVAPAVAPVAPAAAPAGDAQPALLPALFAEQARRTPDAVALVDGDDTVSYRELAERSSRLAHHLISLGLGPEDIVAVGMRRGADLVAAFLAVLQAGAAYLPLDLQNPAQRLALMTEDARPAALLTHSGSAAPAGAVVTVLLDDPATRARIDAAPATGPGDTDRVRPLHPDHPAYIIYTSGSTGRPKGVVVTHRPLAAYLAYARGTYPSAARTTLLHSSVAFDMTVTTLYAPLTSGGTIRVGALEDPAPSPALLKVTPSHMALLATLPPEAAPTEQLVVGGELLLAETVDAFRARHPKVTVLNEYGPTEATVGCCVHTVSPGDTLPSGAVAIGRPTWTSELRVLDEELRPTDDGELYIAGGQLARGYLRRPALTAERFVADPYGPPGTRMYRTGDRVRRADDGTLFFLGRLDGQVKIRGYRVELGEIESALLRHPAVSRTAVTVHRTPTGDTHLVAYVVPQSEVEGHVDGGELKKHLADTLPDYMVPSAFLTLDTLPLNANGKLETGRLPAPDFAAVTRYTAPGTPEETLLCDLFAQFSGAPKAGLDDDFFALGGTSLGAAQVANKARRQGIRVSLQDIADHRTVRRLRTALAPAAE